MNKEESSETLEKIEKLLVSIVNLLNKHQVTGHEYLFLCYQLLELCRVKLKVNEEDFDLNFDMLRYTLRKRLKKR